MNDFELDPTGAWPRPAAPGDRSDRGPDRETSELAETIELVRRRLESMGARIGRLRCDLDDLVQETVSVLVESGVRRSPAWWISVASNKARDSLRAAGRAPIEEVGDQTLEVLAPAAGAGGGDDWSGLCRGTRTLGSDSRRVLAMRQGLDLDWRTIAFVEARRSEAARSLYYRGRGWLRLRPSAPPDPATGSDAGRSS